MARAAAGSGADGAPLQLGPEGADVRACGGELTSQGLLACGFEFAPQAVYLLHKDRECRSMGARGRVQSPVWRKRQSLVDVIRSPREGALESVGAKAGVAEADASD